LGAGATKPRQLGDHPDGWANEKVQELRQRIIDSGLATEFKAHPDLAADALAQIEAIIDGAETEELEAAIAMREKAGVFDPNNVDGMHTF
jgi:hypothetical protein